MAPPKFLANLVVLCLERRCPQASNISRSKSKERPLPKFRADYNATVWRALPAARTQQQKQSARTALRTPAKPP